MTERARSRWQTRGFDSVLSRGVPDSINVGKRAAHAWLKSHASAGPALMPWHAEITLDVRDEPATVEFDARVDTRFVIEIYSEEWGYFFCHRGRASWIRITDIAFVHGRDDFGLLQATPELEKIGGLVRAVETAHDVELKRAHALVRTNLFGAEPIIRAWVRAL